MSEAENEEDKAAQLAQYKEQLVAVDHALKEMDDAEEKDEEGYAALKDAKADLLEVITLLEGIVQAPAAPQAAPQQGVQQHQYVGRTCEAHISGQWFNAEIFQVIKDASGKEKAMLTVFGQKERRECSFSHIRMLKPPHPAQCKLGAKCQAIYVHDGLWYEATIEEHTDTGYKVHFPDYGSKEDVKHDQIRFKTASSASAGAAQKRPIEEITTTGGYRLPKNLLVKPEDTDQIRANKKRKIDLLKKEQRKEREDVAVKQEAHGWQKFLQKGNAGKKGFRKAGMQRQSVFASKDDNKPTTATAKQQYMDRRNQF